MILKYIILKNKNTPILFPREPFSHYEVAYSLGEITSINIQMKQGDSKIQKNIKTDYPIQSIYIGKRNGKIVIEEKK